MKIPRGVRLKLPGNFTGGLYMFLIIFGIAFAELMIIRKANFSISGRSQYHGFAMADTNFVGLPEEIMKPANHMLCEEAEGIWQPLDPNEPMNAEGCCAEAMDPEMLMESEIPLCEDVQELEEFVDEPAADLMDRVGDEEDEDQEYEGRGKKRRKGKKGRTTKTYRQKNVMVSTSGGGSKACACSNGHCEGDCDDIMANISRLIIS